MTNTNEPWVFGESHKRNYGAAIEGKAAMTVAAALEIGGLDWTVSMRPIRSDDEDGVKSTRHKMTVRHGKEGEEVKFRELGVVKSRYTVLQNKAAFSFFDKITFDGAAIVKAVGHLDFGRYVWAMAEREDSDVELFPGAVVRDRFLLSTSHDGTTAVQVRFAPYRTDNGTSLDVSLGRAKANTVRVRHTKSMEVRMGTIEHLLIKNENYYANWRATLLGEGNKLGLKNTFVTADDVDKVVKHLFPSKVKKDELGEISESTSKQSERARTLIRDRIKAQTEVVAAAYKTAGQEAPEGPTALDVFLGVSDYVARDRKTRKEGNAWLASNFGSGTDLRQRAFDLLCGQ